MFTVRTESRYLINWKSKRCTKTLQEPADVSSAHVWPACERMDDEEWSAVTRCLNKAKLSELARSLEGRLIIQNYLDN